MKILVLGNSTWDNRNAVGNTLSNWFEQMPDTQFRFIYNRDEDPQNECCEEYYSISTTNIIKNLLTPWKIGHVFYPNSDPNYSVETVIVNRISGALKSFLLLCADILYKSNIWLNTKTKKYIKEFDPDIVFLFSIADSFRYNLVNYIKINTSAKIVQFIADDVYGAYCNSHKLLDLIRKKRYPKMLKMSDKVYGASEQMCDVYSSLFGVDIIPLYKGCILGYPRKNVNTPLTITYAGNLFYGRIDVIKQIAGALNSINEHGLKVVLDVYSNSTIAAEDQVLLQGCLGTNIHGVIPYKSICEKMKNSDIVLHVESFEKRMIDVVRYSFSTKIIDCLQSGSVMMAIGPNNISSVEYVRKIPGAIVINDIIDISPVLKDICSNPDSLIARAASINSFAMNNHDINIVRCKLYNDLKTLSYE